MESPKDSHKENQSLTVKDKATLVNRDTETYGSFAEIGAGQEVARWFFKAGAASNTIAKTISAYDMTFSDAIYGKEKSGRYVVESRLNKMLEHEYNLLIERLDEQRGDKTRFFTYANTVAARSRNVEHGHGWIGVRFQHKKSAEPSEIIIHVNLLDPRNFMQQEVIGSVSVNLIYGALYLWQKPLELLDTLADDIGTTRMEVDMIRFSGPAFEEVDNRLMSLHLVEKGLASWALFGPKKKVIQPSDALYGKHVLVQRGSFRPVTHIHVDMLNCALGHYSEDIGIKKSEITPVMEITMNNLRQTGELDINDFLARVDILSALGYHVLITDYPTVAQLSQKLREQRTPSRSFVLGVEHLATVFQEGRYDGFNGGVMEAMGLLFGGQCRVYIYPFNDKKTSTTHGAENFNPPEKYANIFKYLLNEKLIQDLNDCKILEMDFHTRDIVKKIEN
ncbi:MAG: hypothetical protein KDD25_06030, partial [Bdellovibrionales bacterium]|nr:hypothetical protein [Bdellovibrionales bacterium]